MGERNDLPKIKPEKQPTIFNHEAGKWGFLTSIVASIALVPAMMKEMGKTLGQGLSLKEETKIFEQSPRLRNLGLVAIGAEILGALFGGFQEKQKQEKEQVDGRVVKTPGYWNKGILSGLFVSSLISSVAVYGFKKPISGAVGTLISLGGAVVGSVMRKNELQRDFDQATAQQAKQQEENTALLHMLANNQLAHAPVTYKNSVAPDEALALEQKLHQAAETEGHAHKHAAHNPHASHAEKHLAAAENGEHAHAAVGA